MKISIAIEAGPPQKTQKECSLVERVRELCKEVDSEVPDHDAWARLCYIWTRLAPRPKLTPEQKLAFDIMRPTIERHGQAGGARLMSHYPHEYPDGSHDDDVL